MPIKPEFYFIGCSSTHCDDLSPEKRLTHGWPALVSHHHGANFINDAISGGTNDRTVSYILQNLNRFDRYYIQWTYDTRFTLYDSSNWFEINFHSTFAHQLYAKKDHFKTFAKYYYTYWASPIFTFRKWLEQVVMIQTVMKDTNSWYLMLLADNKHWKKLICDRDKAIDNIAQLVDITNFSDDMILEQYDRIDTLRKMIDMSKFVDPLEFVMRDVRKMFPLGPTRHPLEEGQQYTADIVISWEKKNKNIYTQDDSLLPV